MGSAVVWMESLLGDRAHAKSVNHSIWKINGVFWSSLPLVSGEWPVQQRAQQAGAEVSADGDGNRGIMKWRPGLWLSSAHPDHPAVKGARCQRRSVQSRGATSRPRRT